MSHVLVLLCAVAGFGALCVARERHQRDLLGRLLPASQARLLRIGGAAALAAALLIAMVRFGWAYGLVEALGHFSLAALLTVLLLTRRAGRKTRPPPR